MATASKSVKDLHDHLKSTGTGKSKLDAIKGSPSIAAACMTLAASFPGTFAKAQEYLGDEMPEDVVRSQYEAAGDAAFRAAIVAGVPTAEAGEIARKAAAAAGAKAPPAKPAEPAKDTGKDKDEPKGGKPVPPAKPAEPPKS